MPKYYLHAEAFNLHQTVYDTHDISTIRGGSYLLLDAIDRLPKTIPGRLHLVTAAASKGLFVYEDSGDFAAQRKDMALPVLQALHDAAGGFASFLVAIAEDIPDDFPRVLAQLEADVRRQQWRTPTVIVPDFDATEQECYLDGWRPGVIPYQVDRDAEDAKISRATNYRRQRGRELRHTLFRELFTDEDADADPCPKDLGELATDPNKGILSGKIAFIHVDGNSFGRIRNAKCDNSEKRKEFDQCVQARRRSFLAGLAAAAHADPDFHVCLRTGKDVLRLEVLLWGGDECTLVVPAWKGLEVLERFFRATATLEFDGIPMTHRAAVIFCHHNAPILQIRRLAEQLLSETKDDIKNRFRAARGAGLILAGMSDEDADRQIEWVSSPKYGNAARYLVLESFDMLRGSLERFLERYYGKADTSDLLLYGHEMAELRSHLHTICAAAPKGRVIEVARSLSAGDTAPAEELRKRLPDLVAPDVRQALDALTKDHVAGWFLLADLWDYAKEWKA
jgi:hypothetical protein